MMEMRQNQDDGSEDSLPIIKRDYKVFTKAEKDDIIQTFKKKVLENHWEKEPEISAITSKKLLAIIKKWPSEKIDEILRHILPNYVDLTFLSKIIYYEDPIFKIKQDNVVKPLREWRKRIRNWLESSEKSDNRGGRLFVHNQKDVDQENLKFRELALNQVLSTMAFRDHNELKQKFLILMQNLEYSENPSLKRTFSLKNFSKHWWWQQCHKDKVLKDAWKKLPLKRSPRKKMKIDNRNIEELNKRESTLDQTSESCNQKESLLGQKYHNMMSHLSPERQ